MSPPNVDCGGGRVGLLSTILILTTRAARAGGRPGTVVGIDRRATGSMLRHAVDPRHRLALLAIVTFL